MSWTFSASPRPAFVKRNCIFFCQAAVKYLSFPLSGWWGTLSYLPLVRLMRQSSVQLPITSPPCQFNVAPRSSNTNISPPDRLMRYQSVQTRIISPSCQADEAPGLSNTYHISPCQAEEAAACSNTNRPCQAKALGCLIAYHISPLTGWRGARVFKPLITSPPWQADEASGCSNHLSYLPTDRLIRCLGVQMLIISRSPWQTDKVPGCSNTYNISIPLTGWWGTRMWK